MMMKTRNKLRSIFLLVLFVCAASVAALAQGPGFDDDVQDAPVDGGATVMIAAAVGYVVKRAVDKRKK